MGLPSTPEAPRTPARWSTAVSVIPLAGADALRFLHGQSSQAIVSARPGDCLATCLISPTARMRGLALVLVRPQVVDLLVLAGDPAAIHQGLDRVLFPADQVKLGAPQPATLVRWIGGAQSEAVQINGAQLHAAAGPCADGGELLRPGVDLGAGADQPALLLRPGDRLPDWLAALPELEPEQVERQRIRQGFPATGPANGNAGATRQEAAGGEIGGEINDSTNPFELGLSRWVSLNKGCYVGQETLAKLATYDGVKQQLRHWRLRDGQVESGQLENGQLGDGQRRDEGASQPSGRGGNPGSSGAAIAGLRVGATLTTAQGERAGVITSLISGPGGPEGLALVRRAALGQSTLLAGGDGPLLELVIRTPAAFVPPPVGAGAQG